MKVYICWRTSNDETDAIQGKAICSATDVTKRVGSGDESATGYKGLTIVNIFRNTADPFGTGWSYECYQDKESKNDYVLGPSGPLATITGGHVILAGISEDFTAGRGEWDSEFTRDVEEYLSSGSDVVSDIGVYYPSADKFYIGHKCAMALATMRKNSDGRPLTVDWADGQYKTRDSAEEEESIETLELRNLVNPDLTSNQSLVRVEFSAVNGDGLDIESADANSNSRQPTVMTVPAGDVVALNLLVRSKNYDAEESPNIQRTVNLVVAWSLATVKKRNDGSEIVQYTSAKFSIVVPITVKISDRDSDTVAKNKSFLVLVPANRTAIPGIDDTISDKMLQTLDFVEERCALGYEGALCLGCTVGRAKFGGEASPCSPCLSVTVTYVLSGLAILIATLIILWLIRWAISKTAFRKNVGIELLKICYNHLQLLAIMSGFPVEWPDSLRQFFSAFETASMSGAAVLSPDCLINGGSMSKRFGSKIYVRALTAALLPVSAVLLISIFWRLRTPLAACIVRSCGAARGRCKRNFAVYLAITPKEARQNARIANVMVLFVIHLMMVRTALDFFVCKDIAKESSCPGDKIKFLEADPTVRCWEGDHTLWALGLGLPMLLVYGGGIPASAFAILYHRRKKLQEVKCKEVYGFLYSSFKPKYYYWDCLIYARKAFFAMAATLLRPSGPELQCSAGIFVLFIAYSLHSHLQPFGRVSLNRTESYGLLASLGTLFCGLAMQSRQSGEAFKVVLAVMIFIMNVGFIAIIAQQLYAHSEDRTKSHDEHKQGGGDSDLHIEVEMTEAR
eukprot:g3809.t1